MSLAAIHPRHKTPVNAVTFQTVVTLVGGLGLGYWVGPDQVFYLMVTVLTLALALIYGAGNLGVFLYYRKQGAEFRWILHALFPLIATLAVLWVAYKSIFPLPPAPLAYVPAIVAAWLLAGVIVLIVSKGLGREDRLLEAGEAACQTAE